MLFEASSAPLANCSSAPGLGQVADRAQVTQAVAVARPPGLLVVVVVPNTVGGSALATS